MRLTWRVYLIILSLFLGTTVFSATILSAQEVGFETKADFAFIMDVDKNIVFLEKKADVAMAPASMSKLMTLAIIFRELKAGRIKLTDDVRMSVNAWRTGGAPSGTAAMFVPVKSTITVEQVLRGIIIQSGNDAAIAIAEHISGTEAKFSQVMEAYGKKIGLTKSTFRNATGLPAEGHLMSAKDLALLGQHLILTYPEYYGYFAEPSFQYRKYKFRNRNPLLPLNEGFDGLKTGYTKQSKYGIVVSLNRKGRRLIGVLNGLEKKSIRKEEARRVMNWAFEYFVSKYIKLNTQKFSARVWGGDRSFVTLSTAGDLKILAPRDDTNPEIISEVIYTGPLKAPITQGQAVAKLRVQVANTTQEYDLFANESVKRVNFVYRAMDSLFFLTFGWIF